MPDSHDAGGAELRPLVTTLDGPSGLAVRRPSTPPEPIGVRHLRIVATSYDGTETMVLVDRPDFPVWPEDWSAEPEPEPVCVEAAPSDAQAPQADVFQPEAEHAEPGGAKAPHEGSKVRQACSHCGCSFGRPSRAHRAYCSGRCQRAAHRARRGTPVVFEREDGRR
ncbi:MAG: hypothetical protein IPM35_20325 [Myxococcales bacterium]|nr:hypothetical protein [Myxococcales bacterium]